MTRTLQLAILRTRWEFHGSTHSSSISNWYTGFSCILGYVPLHSYSLLLTWMFVVPVNMTNFAGSVLLWLVDRGRRTLERNKIAESGRAKLQPHHQSDSWVVTQNLACAVDSYSRSAAAEIWYIWGTRRFIRVPESHFVSHLNPIRFWISQLYNILVSTHALYGIAHKGFRPRLSVVTSTKDLFVKTVLWLGGISFHSGSENVRLIIGSQSAECPIQQPFCLLGRIWTPFLHCILSLNDCHLYDLISQRPLMCQHLSAVSIKCFSCNADVQYCNLLYLWSLFCLTSRSSWCRPLSSAQLVLTTYLWGRVMHSGWRRLICINAATVPPGSTLSWILCGTSVEASLYNYCILYMCD
jgi:hypothetical protein